MEITPMTMIYLWNINLKTKAERTTAVWQNGGFSA